MQKYYCLRTQQNISLNYFTEAAVFLTYIKS